MNENLVILKRLQEKKTVKQALSDWKQTMMTNYENRIRELSTPEKVFSYFASVTKGRHKYMTPDDFMRSIIPFQQRTKSSSRVCPTRLCVLCT